MQLGGAGAGALEFREQRMWTAGRRLLHTPDPQGNTAVCGPPCCVLVLSEGGTGGRSEGVRRVQKGARDDEVQVQAHRSL